MIQLSEDEVQKALTYDSWIKLYDVLLGLGQARGLREEGISNINPGEVVSHLTTLISKSAVAWRREELSPEKLYARGGLADLEYRLVRQ